MQGQQRVCDLAGIGLALNVESPALAYLVDWHFGRLPDAVDTDSSIVITLRRVSERPGTDLGGARRVASMSVVARPESLVAEHDSGGLVETDRRSITVSLWTDPDREWLCTRQLLFIALTWALAHHERTVLHGALVAKDHKAVLLLGGTGQGKSTFAIAALSAGWQVHADDLVVLSNDGTGALTGYGIPKRMSISTETQALLGSADLGDLEPVPGDPRHRSFLPTTALEHGAVEIASLALAGHDNNGGQLRPLDNATTLQEVVSSFGLADEPQILKRVFTTLVALGSFPGFEALHAVDPSVRLSAAVDLLSQMIDRAQ